MWPLIFLNWSLCSGSTWWRQAINARSLILIFAGAAPVEDSGVERRERGDGLWVKSGQPGKGHGGDEGAVRSPDDKEQAGPREVVQLSGAELTGCHNSGVGERWEWREGGLFTHVQRYHRSCMFVSKRCRPSCRKSTQAQQR